MPSDMSNEQWEFYSCEIDSKPHSTMVDLSYFDLAPINELKRFHCFEVALVYPNLNNGMTTNQESQVLNKMEDLIIQSQTSDLKYVARQTGNGKRKFYFYTNRQANFDSVIETIAEAFPTYESTNFNFEDADWRTYFEDLYPNAMAMNEITNRAVFVNLEKAGDDLSIPRNIDHSIVFKDGKKAKEFAEIAKQKGFTVDIEKRGFLKRRLTFLFSELTPQQTSIRSLSNCNNWQKVLVEHMMVGVA